MKIYDVSYFDSLVYAVSLVEDPAIEEAYVALAKQSPVYVALENEDSERRVVIGPCLIPDQLIYRRNGYSGEEYYIRFSAEAIAQLSRKFLSQREVTIDHERFADGAYVAESWIKTDMDKDKSVAVGLNADLPVGTWFISLYVDSEELWQQVKSGRWTGFSIEAWIRTVEDEMKNEKNATMEENKKNKFLTRMAELFETVFGDPKEEVNEENTTAQEELAAEETVTEQAEEHQENLSEEAPADETPTDEVPVEEAPAEETAPEEEHQENLSAEVESLRSQLAEAVDSLGKANAEIERLSKRPSAEPVDIKASTQSDRSIIDTIAALRDGTYFKA